MSNGPSPRELSISEFVGVYVRRIAQLPGCEKVAFDPVGQVIRFEYQGQVHLARPQNAYAEYKKDISRLDAVLDKHINGIRFMQAEIPRSFAAVAPSLMPMVRDRRYLELALLMGRVSGPRVLELSEVAAFPFREIAGELVLTLVRDSADSTLQVSERDLKQWGVSFDQACEVAMENLRGRTELRMEELVPGLYGSKWHDTYDATRMVLTDLLGKLPLGGDLVVSAPTRTHLLVAGSDNPAALAAMISTAVQLLESDPKPLSADLLQFSGNRWTESSLRNAPDLANARRKLLHRDYLQQKEWLDKLHQANGTDLFVASYRLAKDEGKGEHLVNITQLTEGVVTLLAEADYVILLTRARETLIITWADFEAVMGGLLKKLNMHPPRYLAETFPDPQQLVALRTKVVKFPKAGQPQQPRQEGTAAGGLAARALEAAEVFRKSVRDQLKVELGYDLEGVRWLGAYVEQLHQRKVAVEDNQVEAVGAFLGECFIRNLGGAWSLHDDMEMVRFNEDNGVFPFNKVRKHWSNGREGGDSLLGMYEAVVAMQPGRAAAAGAGKVGSHRIATQEPAVEREQVLASLRQRYAAVQQNPAPRTFESMCAPNPSWMKSSDALSEVGKAQLRLLAEGTIFWAALVQVNQLMLSPGTADCPGLLVYSTDPHFDSRPHELQAIASRIFELKESTPADPELKDVARLVTDEMDRSMGWKVPEALTDKDVRTAAFMVFRKHIPGGVLTASQFPILVHPSTQAVMIVPFETWPSELVLSWKPQTEGRTLEEIRRLPEGLRVTHSPNPVAAVMGRDKDVPFTWEFSTTVEASHAELNIVEFGCFNLSNGTHWRFSNMGGRPFSAQQFAEWYSCKEGALKPGRSATDPKNWSRSKHLRSGRSIWYYIGKDAEGNLFRGEAQIEQRGTLVPPHSAAPAATKAPGGFAAVARVFAKAGGESLLRFDGVYRVKQQPRNDEDQRYCYLRLYPDKTALYTLCTENPSELTKSFNVKSGNVPRGEYKVSGDSIRIEFRATNAALVFSGTVDKNRLVLESRRFSNSAAVRDEFLFMGWLP